MLGLAFSPSTACSLRYTRLRWRRQLSGFRIRHLCKIERLARESVEKRLEWAYQVGGTPMVIPSTALEYLGHDGLFSR
jgi:hypothetical protein